MQSSPSHEPVPLPSRLPSHLTGAERRHMARFHRLGSHPREPRVESTQSRDTSPEPSSSGEETAGDDRYDERWAGAIVPIGGEEADADADWVDEDEEVDLDDLLELEYHSSYVRAAEKRRRRWEIGWETLTQAFQNLNRQTDTTMVLVASPADSSKLHMISSRSIRRTPVLSRSPAMHQLKASFRGVAQHRRQTRTRKIPIIDHILTASSAGGDGSDGGSSESREGDLRPWTC
ncbi:hypothetical protein M378DRAFT_1059175 [Amanita muscaria Koide BX008]|uniref:Uncharacterized protein n=1 Tax=Amanita muscaria (strain Koide BX008) TaxID=946122 RepID=A0A0C2RVL4_AMAMK|nr:hypothetical protein M378DRAFT_1059175 [Amanita muscaria Koide BX008]